MGTLEIHFTAEDLSNTRIAAPDPLWEIVSSLHRLQTRHGYTTVAGWHNRVRADLARDRVGTAVHDTLLPLVPFAGYFPDFLTPRPGTDVDQGVAEVIETPADRMAHELRLLTGPRRADAFLVDLAAGRPAARRRLGDALRGYYHTAVAPYWDDIAATAAGDRAARGALVLAGGVGRMLADLSPTTDWQAPVLSVRGYPEDRRMDLGGRGLTLVPSYFCWRTPIALADPDLPPVLVYPARRRPAGPDTAATQTALGPLIGRTRLAVLRAVAAGATTGEVARRVGISAATASHHASVLRDAGLVASERHANLMVHRLTRLGVLLLQGDDADGR